MDGLADRSQAEREFDRITRLKGIKVLFARGIEEPVAKFNGIAQKDRIAGICSVMRVLVFGDKRIVCTARNRAVVPLGGILVLRNGLDCLIVAGAFFSKLDFAFDITRHKTRKLSRHRILPGREIFGHKLQAQLGCFARNRVTSSIAIYDRDGIFDIHHANSTVTHRDEGILLFLPTGRSAQFIDGTDIVFDNAVFPKYLRRNVARPVASRFRHQAFIKEDRRRILVEECCAVDAVIIGNLKAQASLAARSIDAGQRIKTDVGNVILDRNRIRFLSRVHNGRGFSREAMNICRDHIEINTGDIHQAVRNYIAPQGIVYLNHFMHFKRFIPQAHISCIDENIFQIRRGFHGNVNGKALELGLVHSHQFPSLRRQLNNGRLRAFVPIGRIGGILVQELRFYDNSMGIAIPDGIRTLVAKDIASLHCALDRCINIRKFARRRSLGISSMRTLGNILQRIILDIGADPNGIDSRILCKSLIDNLLVTIRTTPIAIGENDDYSRIRLVHQFVKPPEGAIVNRRSAICMDIIHSLVQEIPVGRYRLDKSCRVFKADNGSPIQGSHAIDKLANRIPGIFNFVVHGSTFIYHDCNRHTADLLNRRRLYRQGFFILEQDEIRRIKPCYRLAFILVCHRHMGTNTRMIAQVKIRNREFRLRRKVEHVIGLNMAVFRLRFGPGFSF